MLMGVQIHSLRVGWRNLVRVSLIFAIIISFMLLFQRNSDSRFTWIHDFEEKLIEYVGHVPFSAQYLICRHVQTDRQTDELIRVELGNLSVPPVINPAYTHLYAAGCIAMNKIPYLPQFSGEMDHHWLKLKLEISRMQCMGEGEEGKVEWFEKRRWLPP